MGSRNAEQTNAQPKVVMGSPENRSSATIEDTFRRSVQDVTDTARILRKAQPELANQLNGIARRIDDGYFRLQIWGSTLEAELARKPTLEAIFTLKDSLLPDIMSDILDKTQAQFTVLSECLSKIMFVENPIVEPLNLQGLVDDARAAVESISDLIQRLVQLSSTIRTEQALQNQTGRYHNIHQHIQGEERRLNDNETGQSSWVPVEKQDDSDVIGRERDHVSVEPPTAEQSQEPWRRKLLLSLDGGGVRGYSSLLILEQLMKNIRRVETEKDKDAVSSYYPCEVPSFELGKDTKRQGNVYLPCHYFDYVAGASTGGLIAIMLGRLRMSIADCMEEYCTFSDRTFGKPRRLTFLGFPRSKYSGSTLEATVDEIVRRRSHGFAGQKYMGFASPPQLCKTLIVASATTSEATEWSPYIFRSYDSVSEGEDSFLKQNPGPASQNLISQIARATSAAPTYFSPVQISGITFSDGGLMASNPALLALQEVSGQNEEVEMILSIGGGKSEAPSRISRGLFGMYWHYLNIAKKLASDAGTVDRNVEMIAAHRNFSYSRFNVEHGLGGIRLDEWKTTKSPSPKNETLRHITEATQAYLASVDIQFKMRGLAEVLVEHRRRRSKTPQWETFCGLAVELKVQERKGNQAKQQSIPERKET